MTGKFEVVLIGGDTNCANPRETRGVQHPRGRLALPVLGRMSFKQCSAAQLGGAAAGAPHGWGKALGQGGREGGMLPGMHPSVRVSPELRVDV